MDETLNAQAYRLDCLAGKILAGNLSAAMNKRAEDWTLPELKAIAAELSAHGDESNIYAKVKEAIPCEQQTVIVPNYRNCTR